MKEPDKTNDSTDRLSALLVCRNMEIEELVEQNRNYLELIKMLAEFTDISKAVSLNSSNVMNLARVFFHVSNNSYDPVAAIEALKDVTERLEIEGAV